MEAMVGSVNPGSMGMYVWVPDRKSLSNFRKV